MTGAESLQQFQELVANANSLFLSDEDFVIINGVAKPTLQKVYAEFLASMGVYNSVAEGLSNTSGTGTNNRFFTVPGTDGVFESRYRNDAGSAVLVGRSATAEVVFDIDERTQDLKTTPMNDIGWGVADPKGNVALGVNSQGQTLLQDLVAKKMGSDDEASTFWDIAFKDGNGNIALGYDKQGRLWSGGQIINGGSAADTWKEFGLGQDDTIVHGVDSYTASYYVVKDKSYLAQLSQLSPYRHLSFGVSGDDLLDAQYRAINGSAATGATLKAMNARYFVIASLTNDGQFRLVDQTYYAENLRRLIDTIRAYGTEPIVATEFPATSIEHALLSRVAEETGCAFIDCTTLNREVGGLQVGPFHQGHPGSRTGGVFWMAMLDYIDRMPRPDRAIKIYRRRQGWPVSTPADLLYKDRVDRAKRWKELTTFHYSFDTASEGKYDELGQLNYNGETPGYTAQVDEYLKIASGQAVSFTDYALLEITLPGNATSLEAVEITLGVSGTAQFSVRDYLDVAASMPGKIQGSSPTDPTYLSKWEKPRGAWRNLGNYGAPITIAQAELSRSMTGNTLVVMLTGAFSLNALKIRYKGSERKSDLRNLRPYSPVGANLVSQPLCGTTAQQASWVVTQDSGGQGPIILVPIDQYNAPRKPGTSSPVDGVSVVTSTRMLGQAVTIPADEGRPRRYRITVWARYFPKAFLRPEVYPGLDAAQVIDRGLNPTAAPVTQHTLDLRTLKCEIWTGSSYPTAGGAEFQDFAAMQWRPIKFDYDAVPYITGTTLNFRLSCPDGEIQIGKVLMQEIQKWD